MRRFGHLAVGTRFLKDGVFYVKTEDRCESNIQEILDKAYNAYYAKDPANNDIHFNYDSMVMEYQGDNLPLRFQCLNSVSGKRVMLFMERLGAVKLSQDSEDGPGNPPETFDVGCGAVRTLVRRLEKPDPLELTGHLYHDPRDVRQVSYRLILDEFGRLVSTGAPCLELEFSLTEPLLFDRGAAMDLLDFLKEADRENYGWQSTQAPSFGL